MAKIYEVSFKIGADMAASFAKTMSGASGALGELNKRIGDISSAQGANQRVLELRQGVASAAQEFQAAQARAQQLAAAIASTSNPSKEMLRDQQKAESAVEKARVRMQNQAQTLREVTEQNKLTGRSTADLVAEQNRLTQSAERAAKAQQALQQNVAAQQANMEKRGQLRGQLFDAVALGGTLAAPVMQAVQWEQSLAEFNKVAGKTQEEVNAVSLAAQEMAVATGVAREEIMGAYIAAAQAGFDESEWEKYAEVASKMGIAFDITGEQAGEMLKAWRSSMGLSMDEAEKLAAATNHIANNMNATAEGIGNVLLRQGAVMRSAGLSDTQSAALAAAMLSGGATDEVAATASKNFLLALTKGSAATKTQQGALAALGFSDPERLAKAMQVAPEKAIILVLEQIKKLDAHEQTAIMTQLFGSESIGGIAPLIANLDNLAGAFSLVANEADYINSLQEEFDGMGNTTANQFNKARESIKMITTTIGNTLLPTVNTMLATFAPLALSFGKFAQDNAWLVKAITLTAAAMISAKVAAITLGYAWTFIKGAYLAVRGVILAGKTAWMLYNGSLIASTIATKAATLANRVMAAALLASQWTAVTAQIAMYRAAQLASVGVTKIAAAATWLFNGALLANPIVLVVAGIAALIAAGIALYKNWDVVTGFFSAAWERIKSLFLMFNPLSWMMSGFNALTNWLSNFSLFESGAAILTTLKDGIISAATSVIDSVKDTFSTIRDYLPFSDAKVGPLSELTHNGMMIMETLAKGISSVAGAPAGAISSAFDMVSGGLSNAASFLGFGDGDSSGGGMGGGMTIQITQNISVGSGDAYEQAKRGASAGAEDLARDIQRALERERRLSYG